MCIAVASPVVVGFVAMTTSVTPSALDARVELGELQVLGIDAVDRRQRAAEHVVATAELVRALDGMTSPASSTTQMTVGSRRASSQIVQRGPSARLKQISHGPISALTSRIASDSAMASSSVLRRMWKARRCAVRAPMPGSLPSSVMRRWTGGACSVYLVFCARRAARLGAPREAAGQPAAPRGRPPPSPPSASSIEFGSMSPMPPPILEAASSSPGAAPR